MFMEIAEVIFFAALGASPFVILVILKHLS